MITFPNSKINLGLSVTAKRPDGFHNIETVLYPYNLCDILEIVLTGGEEIVFTASGLPVPGNLNTNLCLKAAHLLVSGKGHLLQSYSRHAGSPVDRGLRIHLHKAVPPGAGLGGGSSDGAYVIRMLNDLLHLGLSVPEMQQFAAQLGSDSPFFIYNKPVFASGRGDQFSLLDLDLTKYQIVVITPPIHVSTPEAYTLITPAKPAQSIKEIIQLPVSQWRGRLVNDFEEPVFARYPLIREAKEKLYADGALYASMSGSGSAVYGIFAG